MLSGFLNVPAVDGAYWSLFVEIRFYVMAAVLIALGWIKHIRAVLWAWLIFIILLKWVIFHRSQVLHAIFLGDYADCFIAGAAFFLVWQHGMTRSMAGLLAASWLLSIHNALGRVPAQEQHDGVNFSESVIAIAITFFYLIFWAVSIKKTGWIGARRWTIHGCHELSVVFDSPKGWLHVF